MGTKHSFGPPKIIVLSPKILFIGTKHSFGPLKIIFWSPQVEIKALYAEELVYFGTILMIET